MEVQISLHNPVFISFEYIPRRGIAEFSSKHFKEGMLSECIRERELTSVSGKFSEKTFWMKRILSGVLEDE